MAFSAKSLRLLSYAHLVLGILAMAAGIASMKVTDYYSGLFGMGIWLGAWVLLTGLGGVGSSLKPGNFCRIGIFLGCSLVAIVILSICSIIIGTVVIRHFQFESSVTREFYEGKGTFGQKNHEDYYKPDEYFEDRHENGIIGLAVYGSLLAINIGDILLCCASVYVCRDLTRSEQIANRQSSSRSVSLTRRTQGNIVAAVPDAQLGIGGQHWAELVLQAVPQSLQPMPVHFIQSPDCQVFTPYKLPNYAELYPEGIVNSSITQNQPHIPDEPPPEYTPTANPLLCGYPMLPGSSVEAPLNSFHLSTEENTDEETGVSAGTFTTGSSCEQETSVVSEHSSVTPGLFNVTSDYQVSSSPVLESSAFPMISSIPNTLAISTELAVTISPGLSSNTPQVIASEDPDNTASLESQNNQVTCLETVSVITETSGSEIR